MVKKSNKYEVVKRLTARFKLQESGNNMLLLEDNIVPVTNVDVLLTKPQLKKNTFNISAADTTCYTVPAGKRWRLVYTYYGSSVGTSNLRINDGSQSVVLLNSLQTLNITRFDNSTILDEGWSLILDTTSNGGDTAVRLDIMIEEEDAF